VLINLDVLDADGQVTGSKVSLFDVSDLDNPTEIATWVGPDSWNDVGWDTHAFLWWAAEDLAAIPVQVRVDMPALSGTLYDRQIYRRLQASRGYTLSARIFNKTKREEIVALTGEVLAKTHCKGGSITADMAGGDFARSFGKRAKAPGGGFYAPGWVVSYTYRRWRAK
jgi:hypothetical protein